jgi:hypothetical protein
MIASLAKQTFLLLVCFEFLESCIELFEGYQKRKAHQAGIAFLLLPNWVSNSIALNPFSL